jgi:hypothetical protein
MLSTAARSAQMFVPKFDEFLEIGGVLVVSQLKYALLKRGKIAGV